MTSAGSLKKTKVGAGIFVLIVFRLWHGINVLKISKMFTLLSLMTVTPVRCLNVKCSQQVRHLNMWFLVGGINLEGYGTYGVGITVARIGSLGMSL